MTTLTKRDALKHHAQLAALTARPAGADPEAHKVVRRAVAAFQGCPAYLKEKMHATEHAFDVWFSASKWQKGGEEHARRAMATALSGLHDAIDAQLPDDATVG